MKTFGFRPLILAALIIAACAQSSAQTRSISSQPMRVALLVGINAYANSAQPLKGSVNDVALTRSMLKARGYAPIISLTDSAATGASIQKALDTLRRTQPQDYVYIHFSGYGNKDGNTPVICPSDYRPGGGGIPYSALLAKIDQIPAIRKIAVIDCSFTAGRGTSQTVPRYWPTVSRTLVSQRFSGKRSLPLEAARTMVISAAEKDAPAVETLVVSQGNRRVWAGAMTWAYLRTAQRANNNTTFQQLRGGMDARMAGRLTQTTSMRGFDLGKALKGLIKGAEKILKPAAGLLLSGATGGLSNIVTALLPNASPKTQSIAGAIQALTEKGGSTESKLAAVLGLLTNEQGQPASGQREDQTQGAQPLTITEVQGQTVTVDQGLSADVQPGAILEAPSANGSPPDQIQIISVGMDSSQGQVVQGSVQPSEQVFVTQPAPGPVNDPLVVEISPVGVSADTASISTALTALGYVRVANPGEIVDRRLIVSTSGSPSANLVTVDIAADAAALTGGVSGTDIPSLVQALAPNLASAFLLKKLAVIQNPASRIEMSLSVQNQSGQDATNGVALNDTITINVMVNRPAFITLIDVGTDGAVRVLFPNSSSPSQQAQPGVALRFPTAGRIRVAPPTGKEMLVAIATSKPLDISQFDATSIPNLGVRQLNGRGMRNAANRLRNLVIEAGPDASPGGTSNPSEDSGWGSIFLVFPVSG